jgi:hypothetical protein
MVDEENQRWGNWVGWRSRTLTIRMDGWRLQEVGRLREASWGPSKRQVSCGGKSTREKRAGNGEGEPVAVGGRAKAEVEISQGR